MERLVVFLLSWTLQRAIFKSKVDKLDPISLSS